MKIIKRILKKTRISLFLLVLATTGLRAQNPTYLCELRNDIQVNANTYEFDLYLLRTGSTVFEYTSMQFGININSAVLNGGNLTVSLVGGTSELNSSQIPTAGKFSFNSLSNCIIMTGMAPPGAGSGTIISNSGIGTRVGRIRLTNSVNFASDTPNLTWSFSILNGYITKVNAYVGGIATDITVQASHTTSNLSNATLNPPPTPPSVGTITQPTCSSPTGSVILNGLPAIGTWTLTRNPGGTTTTGSGTSITILGLGAGTYTYTVTNAVGVTSSPSDNININAAPTVPTSPNVGTITQPTCASSTGSVNLNGLPSSGTWTLTRTPGGTTTTGTGISTTISGLASGTYTYTVTNASGCTSSSSGNVVINTQPITPSAPTVGTITQPTCLTSTGSVVLNGLPSSGTWTLTRTPGGTTTTGTGTSTTISGLASGTYTYTVTNASGCTSPASGSVVINAQPATPTAPIVGTITQPTCATSTGSVVLSGLPSGSWTINPGGIAGSTTSRTISGLTANTYNFTVTNSSGCTSPASANVVINAAPGSPSAPATLLTQPTCSVATGTITVTAPTEIGMTYSIDGSNYSNSTGIFSLVASGTYTVTARNAMGCTSAGSIITILAQPPTPVVPNQTAAIPSGGTFTVTPSGAGIPVGTTYTWTTPAYTGGVTGGSAQLSPQLNISGTLTVPSGVGTAIYTVTPVSGSCIGAPFTVTVNVTSVCTAVTIGTQPISSSMCATSGIASFTVVVGGTAPYVYQWQYYNGTTWGSVVNGTPAGAIYTNSTTATLTVAGITSAGSPQYRCFVTNCSGGNSAASAAVTLTVNALPVPTLTSSEADNTFCQGTSITFTAGGGTNYDFRLGGVTVQNGPSTTYTTTSLANGQRVTVVVTNASGCTATSAEIQNIVNALPFIFISTPAACSPDFINYSVGVTVAPGATVTSTSGVVTNSGSNVWTITGILAHTNVTIKATGSGGCENTINVTAPDCNCPVIAAPVSGGDKSYCASGVIPVITATVLTGETVDWYNSSSGGTPLRSGSLSYTPTGPGTYYALARNTASNCVSSTRTAIIVTMNPLPVASLTSSDPDNIFCSGTSIVFTAAGGISYNFLVAGLSVQDGTSSTYTTSSLTNGQVVMVIVSSVNGCTATSAGITNTVNATPVPTITSSDPDDNFCLGTSVTFTAGGGTAYNFRVDGISVQSGTSTTFTTTLLTNGQVVDVIVSNPNGCSATSTGITNSVFETPAATAGTGGNNCGLGFHLNGSIAIGTGTWTKVSGPGNATFSPNANTANAIVTVSAYGSYTFSWTVVNGTCSNSANVTVVFIQQLAANGGPGGSSCDSTFNLKATVPVTGIGTWTKASGPGTALFTPDNHQSNAKVTVNKFGTYSFIWTVVNSICSSSDVVNVIFHDLPSINAGRDTIMCKGGSVQLQAQGIGSVTWDPAAMVSNPAIINPVANPDTTTTFTVNLTDQFGCKNSDTIVVEVREKPIANAGPDQDLGYLFTATMDAVLAHSYENGVWSLISGTGDFSDSTFAMASVINLSSGINKFLWTVSNGYCPPVGDTINITVNDFVIPTLITPNMDGRNDYFVLRGLSTLGKTELVIFDRRGAQVYKNMNYDNLWNGVDYNKNPLPDDTYFYVIKTANGKSISGYIVIRR